MARTDTNRIEIDVYTDFKDGLALLHRLHTQTDFSLVVLEGITAMQKWQRAYAPRGTTGPGPHGRIPRSIRPARVTRRGKVFSATSRTSYGPAIFTNEGTGSRRSTGGGRSYFLYPATRTGLHPGIYGTHWWERGAERGSIIALAAFRRKIERMMMVRGRMQ